MKKVLIFKDNFAFLYLNKNIYSKSKLKLSFKEFKEFINFSISELGKYTVIKIEKKINDYTLKELSYEFANYLLAQEQELKRQ